MNANTYSLDSINNQWLPVVTEYNLLASNALFTYQKIDAVYQDANYQLVLYLILACANLNKMYYTHTKNQQAKANGTKQLLKMQKS